MTDKREPAPVSVQPIEDRAMRAAIECNSTIEVGARSEWVRLNIPKAAEIIARHCPAPVQLTEQERKLCEAIRTSFPAKGHEHDYDLKLLAIISRLAPEKETKP